MHVACLASSGQRFRNSCVVDVVVDGGISSSTAIYRQQWERDLSLLAWRWWWVVAGAMHVLRCHQLRNDRSFADTFITDDNDVQLGCRWSRHKHVRRHGVRHSTNGVGALLLSFEWVAAVLDATRRRRKWPHTHVVCRWTINVTLQLTRRGETAQVAAGARTSLLARVMISQVAISRVMWTVEVDRT